MIQNPYGVPESGICAKFMPHMPLTTTKGRLSVASTESALVVAPSRLDTCVRYAVHRAAQQVAIRIERVVDAQYVIVDVAKIELRRPVRAAASGDW